MAEIIVQYNKGRIKRKRAFEHAQNMRIHIILRMRMRMRRVSSRPLLSINTFCSVSGYEGPDQTARKRRLIWAFAYRKYPKPGFRMARPCMIDTSQSWRRRLLARWHREKWQKNYQYYRVYILRNGIRAKRSYKNKLFFSHNIYHCSRKMIIYIHLKRLCEALLMGIHNIWFGGEIRKIYCQKHWLTERYVLEV